MLCSGRSNLKKLFNYLYIISIDGSFFYPDTYLKKLRMYLLLYYLYCLCKSVQRSLVLRLLFFSKADAKVRTLFHIFQIFSEVFFIFSFFKSSLLRKEEQRKRTVVTARISKRLSNNAALILKAGAKVRTLFHILQINLKFFSFFFLKAPLMKQTAPNNKKKGRVPTPFLSECQTIAAPVLESGCKSSGFGNTHQIYKAFFIRNIKTFS